MEDARTADLDAVLGGLVAAATVAFGGELVAAVLFGSAAEGRLRPTSDVNLVWVLTKVDPAALDRLREPLRVAQSMVGARSMFLALDELPAAAELFAVKFADIKGRHRLLHGRDVLAGLTIDDGALRRGLREVLLNLSLRLRERYVLLSLREEQLVPVIADAAGPLRAAASALLRLQGRVAPSPREALEQAAAVTGDPVLIDAVAALSTARQEQRLPPGVAGPTLLALSLLAGRLRVALEGGA